MLSDAGGFSTEDYPYFTKVVGREAPIEILFFRNECVVFDFARRSTPAVYPNIEIACINLRRTLSSTEESSPDEGDNVATLHVRVGQLQQDTPRTTIRGERNTGIKRATAVPH